MIGRVVGYASLVLAGTLLASAASAAQYYYCYTAEYSGDRPIHYSPILSTDAERIDDRQTGFAFSEHAQEVSPTSYNGSIQTGCVSSSKLGQLRGYYAAMTAKGGKVLEWAAPPVASRPVISSPNEVSIASPTSAAPSTAQPKYVEVEGPNGAMRLSPEVVARNRAAAEDHRRKLADHAAAMAAHQQTLSDHQARIAKAAQERREYERQMVANAAARVASEAAQLEYRKTLAKPAGVNAVYRGFSGPTCEIARRSAVAGAGTSTGTRFTEVTQDLSGMPRTCVVQGWWWNTSRTGSSRQ